MKKKVLFFLILCLFFVSCGKNGEGEIMQCVKQSSQTITYKAGMPVFSDRPNYFDRNKTNGLEGLELLRLPRHLLRPIIIEVYKPITIYRILSPKNGNILFKYWERVNVDINVQGGSCNHTVVVKKAFSSGLYHFSSGGPIASSPLLIGGEENSFLIKNYKIIKQQHNIPPVWEIDDFLKIDHK